MTKIIKILKPIYKYGQLLGISPISNNEKICQKATIKLIFTLIFLYSVFCYFQEQNAILSKRRDLKSVKFIVPFRVVAQILEIGAIHILTVNKKVLYQLIDIDNLNVHFKQLQLDDFLSKSDKIIAKKLYYLYFFHQICINVTLGIVSVFVQAVPNLQILLIRAVVFIYPRLIISSMNLTFYTVICLITYRFKAINYKIQKEITKSKILNNSINFYSQISTVIETHKTLGKITKKFVSLSTLYLFVTISCSFILLSVDFYIGVHFFLFNPFKRMIIVYTIVKNIFIYVYDLLLLVKCSSDVTNEANITQKLLIAFKINIDDEERRNTVTLEFINQKLIEIDNFLKLI